MVWAGLVIALLSGLTGIGLSRESVKRRFPRVADLHLDWFAIGVLFLGLGVSAAGHLRAERQIESLEESSHRVRSFEVDFDIQFTADWEGVPPAAPRVIVMGQSPVAKVEIAQTAGSVRSLELHMDKEPSFGPYEDGWVHTTFRVRAEPGSWIVGSDARKIVEIRRLEFLAYGVRLQDSRDGTFTIGATARVFLNGLRVALLEFSPKNAELHRLPLGDKNPQMVFNGHWVIQQQ
jgi:hypothetical protein